MKIFKLFVIWVWVLLLSACTKVLDTEPYSFTTGKNFYKTAAEIELALTGCYSMINVEAVEGAGGQGATFHIVMPIMLSAGTDELITREGLNNQYSPFGLLSYTSQNEKIRYNWFYLYAGINRANYIVDKIAAVEMSEKRKEEVIGEARFLRGLYYMYLAMMYGGVPIHLTPEHDPALPRQPLEKVYAQIIEDFKFAYEVLPHRAAITGRANKWSAAGFLAKVYTYLGSCKKFSVGADLNFALNSFDWVDENAMYQEALTLTTDIINFSEYTLIDKYSYLFYETTNSFKRDESLFSSLSSTNSTSGNYHVWLYFQAVQGNTNSMGGSQGLFRPTAEIYHKYDLSDSRLDQNLSLAMNTSSTTEVVEGVTYYLPRTISHGTANALQTQFYCVAKYRMMDPAEKQISLSRSSGDVSLLRYADILLLHAEALYYANSDETEAREYLKQVRQRITSSGTELDGLTAAYYKSDFIEELLDERSRELCFENWRRIDLIRFGKLGSVIAAMDRNASYWNIVAPILQENWGSYRIWFPVPRTEFDLAPSLGDQNPRY